MKGDIQMPVPKFAPMPPIDLAGPQGGMLGVAFAAGFIVCGTVLGLAARWFWKMFGDRRIAQLEATIEQMSADHRRDRDEERRRCDEEIRRLHDEVIELRTILLVSGPPNLRAAMKASICQHPPIQEEEQP